MRRRRVAAPSIAVHPAGLRARIPVWLLALSLLVPWLASIAAPRASADERPRVVVVLDARELVFGERVRAELEASGFAAQTETTAQDGDLTLRLAALAQREVARLALAFRTVGARVELSLYDPVRSETVVHTFDAAPESAAALAIRVVELARARLLPVPATAPSTPAIAPAAVSDPATAPEAEQRFEEPKQASGSTERQMPAWSSALARRPRAAIALGAAVLGAPGGLGPSAALSIAAGAFVTRTLLVGAFALVPLTQMEHAALEGWSETRVTPIGVELGTEFLRGTALRAAVAGGFCAALLSTHGHGTMPTYADGTTRRASWGGYVRGGLAYHFTRVVALRTELTAGAQAARFSIDYAGRRVARWGLPWLAGGLALDLRFP